MLETQGARVDVEKITPPKFYFKIITKKKKKKEAECHYRQTVFSGSVRNIDGSQIVVGWEFFLLTLCCYKEP